MNTDLLITHATQLLTMTDGLGLVEDGAVACRDGRVVAVGTTADVLARVDSAVETIDARGHVALPGFVDAHTHVVYAGDRVAEFEMRLRGATYLDIMAAGGGIMSTVRATRAASDDELLAATRARLDRMLMLGTTTVEAKTGYGLDAETERRMLRVIAELNRTHPVDLVPTYLGAHAIPAEYAGQADAFTDFIVEDLGRLAAEEQPIEFVDVFCDAGAFTVEQSEAILTQAQALGYRVKIHADEFAHLGGAALAARLGATSADHLAVTPAEDRVALAQAGVVAVVLPGTSFGLAHTHYADGRALIDAGATVALATDLNPGTCACESMSFMVALACRFCGMTPNEAVIAATRNAAAAVGREWQSGSLAVGRQADILLLETADYRWLAYGFGDNPIRRVIKKGVVVR